MRANLAFTLLATFFASLALAAQQDRTVDVLVWPSARDKPQTIAKVAYTSNNATVKSYTAPKLPSDAHIVTVGYSNAPESWTGVATAASNFAAEKDKTLQLHLNTKGDLYHVGFKASDASKGGSRAGGKDGLDVEIVKMRAGPVPRLNKPVVLSADGSVPEKEPEKSFIQKYWWVIVGVLLVQMVMGGGAKE